MCKGGFVNEKPSTGRKIYSDYKKIKSEEKRIGKKFEGTTINIRSCKCHPLGDHKFNRWRKGFLFGGDKIYICCNCGAEIKQDGTSVWL